MKLVLPSYVTKLPSSGKQVNYRPFTVKEEKALLLALQENDLPTVANAIKNTIRICTDGTVEPDNIPYYDCEFLFLQIRSKSVGEIIDLVGSCDCSPKAKTEFSVDIADVKIEPEPVKSITVKIEDTPYSLIVKHPTITDFVNVFDVGPDSGLETVSRCIESVFTDDEVIEWSEAEKLEFIESMSPKQQKDVAKFLDDMPIVKLDASYKCRACGKQHDQQLSGFENFFV